MPPFWQVTEKAFHENGPIEVRLFGYSRHASYLTTVNVSHHTLRTRIRLQIQHKKSARNDGWLRVFSPKMTNMTSCERFGEFYDAVMGDRSAAADQVMDLIRAVKPDAKNVLELRCGTGSILQRLQAAFEVSGLDISEKILSVARKKVPRSKLFRQDMVDFRIQD